MPEIILPWNELKPLDPLKQDAETNNEFLAGKHVADAEMAAMTECQVLLEVWAIYIELIRILENFGIAVGGRVAQMEHCLLYTSPSPRDRQKSRMPSSA